jgi:hypothetical protein
MLFKEIIAVYSEKRKKHKYKMQSYWNQMGHVFATRIWTVNERQTGKYEEGNNRGLIIR